MTWVESFQIYVPFPAGNYMSKLTIETLEQGAGNTRTLEQVRNTRTICRFLRRFGVFIVNFKHISHLALVFFC